MFARPLFLSDSSVPGAFGECAYTTGVLQAFLCADSGDAKEIGTTAHSWLL